jgi:hypothetical protein
VSLVVCVLVAVVVAGVVVEQRARALVGGVTALLSHVAGRVLEDLWVLRLVEVGGVLAERGRQVGLPELRPARDPLAEPVPVAVAPEHRGEGEMIGEVADVGLRGVTDRAGVARAHARPLRPRTQNTVEPARAPVSPQTGA